MGGTSSHRSALQGSCRGDIRPTDLTLERILHVRGVGRRGARHFDRAAKDLSVGGGVVERSSAGGCSVDDSGKIALKANISALVEAGLLSNGSG